jgi:hypothetical protein
MCTACMCTVRAGVWYVCDMCVACVWRCACMACAWHVHGALHACGLCGVCTSSCSALAFDQEFLNSVFRELEEQLAIARTEREETQSRAERERRASLKRARELEEARTRVPPSSTHARPPARLPASPSRLAACLTLPSPLRRAVSRSRNVRARSQAMREKDREGLALRAQCNAEKEALVKQFEQRVAGLRLEKDQAPEPTLVANLTSPE